MTSARSYSATGNRPRGSPVPSSRSDGAVGPDQQPRVVPGVRVGENPGLRVEGGDDRGGVALGRRAGVEPPAHPGADGVGRVAHLDRAHEEGVERGRDERGRHPLARDVGDHDDRLAGLLARLDLVEVPGHRPRRVVGGEQRVARDLGEALRQQRDLDLPGDRHLPLQRPAAGRLLGERDVADPEGRDRGERGQQLQVLLGVAPHVHPRAENDHPEIGVGSEQRGRHEGAHARAEDALGGGEARVGLGVQDEGGLALLRHLALEAPRDEEVARGPGQPAGRCLLQLPQGALEEDDPLLRPEVREGPVEDELEQLLE